MLKPTRSICGTCAPVSYWIEFRKAPKSLPSTSIGWPGPSRQLSNKYTIGTPSETRYWARLPNVSDELAAMGHVLVKPVSHPFRSTTGARVALDGTEALGCTSTAKVVCLCSPIALVAESLTVYSPGFTRSDAPSRIWSPARFGAATSP